MWIRNTRFNQQSMSTHIFLKTSPASLWKWPNWEIGPGLNRFTPCGTSFCLDIFCGNWRNPIVLVFIVRDKVGIGHCTLRHKTHQVVLYPSQYNQNQFRCKFQDLIKHDFQGILWIIVNSGNYLVSSILIWKLFGWILVINWREASDRLHKEDSLLIWTCAFDM